MLSNAVQIVTNREAPQTRHHATELPIEANALSKRILKAVRQSMDGPQGVVPSDLIAALGALAGYASRWLVIRQVIDGNLADDFHPPKGCNMPYVSHSKQVDHLVVDMTRDSFAGVLTKSMVAAGASWLPDVSANVSHNFVSITEPTHPDYTVEDEYQPIIPAQSSLLMMWEAQARILAHTPGAIDVAVQAYAMAVTQAATESKDVYPMDKAAQIALESAIAMSRNSYAF